jgi:hypothetical protein
MFTHADVLACFGPEYIGRFGSNMGCAFCGEVPKEVNGQGSCWPRVEPPSVVSKLNDCADSQLAVRLFLLATLDPEMKGGRHRRCKPLLQ